MCEDCDCDSSYESGPYCMHWYDPPDCEYLCICGHKCREHCGGMSCDSRNCECEEFEDVDADERKERGLKPLPAKVEKKL